MNRSAYRSAAPWLATILMVLCAPAFAADAEDDPVQVCSAHSQAGLRDCLVAQLKESGEVLARAEAQAGKDLAAWDEDARYIRQAQNRLKAAGSAHARYVQSECAFAAALVGGAAGNASEQRRMACVIRLNTARARQLAESTGALPHTPGR
ncbi:MAG: lysozyme inhibitor LprI family protein [Gammaproteobacteria bacterium]